MALGNGSGTEMLVSGSYISPVKARATLSNHFCFSAPERKGITVVWPLPKGTIPLRGPGVAEATPLDPVTNKDTSLPVTSLFLRPYW